jgi:ATP-dependent DNA helicase Rep
MSLNPAQQNAVDYFDGPLLVIAGAGSGKTRVIAAKVERLLERHLLPEKIAAITFTNKAAREMRERLRAALPSDIVKALNVSTFHSLGLKLLMIERERVGLKRGFAIADPSDALALLKGVLPEHTSKETREHWLKRLSHFKNLGLSPHEVDNAEAQTIYAAYEERLARFNTVDFDDLILKPLKLLEADAEVRTAWQERLRYLLIDEYQDTNLTQYRWLKALAGARGAFTAVGDDDQAIYAFRGARSENLTTLKDDYPRLKVIALEQNYRSTRRILRSANALIAHNPHLFQKKLFSTLDDGEPITVLRCRDPEHEAEVVVTEILRRQFVAPKSLNDYAVLFRSNHQARPLELALRAQRLAYRVSGAMSFFERQEVKDTLAWLRVLVDPDDDQALLRIINRPAREVGERTLDALAEVAAQRGLSLHAAIDEAAFGKRIGGRSLKGLVALTDALSAARRALVEVSAIDALKALLQRIGYREWLKADRANPQREVNLNEALEWLAREERPRDPLALKDWVNQLALAATGGDDDELPRIRLMTLHAAKGLEFACVFLVGLEDGLMPSQNALDEGQEEEERRLFYVGMTRAKQTLYLSHAQTRRRFGQIEKRPQSRFIKELPQAELKVVGSAEDQVDARERSQQIAQSQLARIKAMLGG